MNNYRFGYVDLSWILTRNFYMISKKYGVDPHVVGETLKLTIQTIGKILRENDFTVEKIIFVGDRWKPEIEGYYRTKILRDSGIQFKAGRKYYTEKGLEEVKADPNSSDADIKKYEIQLELYKLKSQAKELIMSEFPKIGFYTYRKEGYEFDDVVTMASFIRARDFDPLTMKKDLIIAVDSDVSYSLSPGCDMFKPKVSSNPGRIITYDEMYATIPQEVIDAGFSLYQYHAMCDILGGSHNGLVSVKKMFKNTNETIIKMLKGDYSNIVEGKLDQFNLQYETFNIWKFPEIDQLENDIITLFDKGGRIPSGQECMDFCNKYDVGIYSERYFTDIYENFDPKYYTE
jgi:hypothetical protein